MIKRIFAVLYFFICSIFYCDGQIDSNYLQIGIIINPEYNKPLFSDEIISNRVSQYQQSGLGYSVGITANYQISRQFSFETGLMYSKKNWHLNFITAKYSRATESFYFMDLPLRFNYWIPISRISIILGIGSSINIPTGHNVEVKDNQLGNVSSEALFLIRNYAPNPNIPKNHQDFFTYETDDIAAFWSNRKNINFSPFITVGLNWDVNERISFKLEGITRYTIKSISYNNIENVVFSWDEKKEEQIHESTTFSKQYLLSLGLSFGMVYTL